MYYSEVLERHKIGKRFESTMVMTVEAERE